MASFDAIMKMKKKTIIRINRKNWVLNKNRMHEFGYGSDLTRVAKKETDEYIFFAFKGPENYYYVEDIFDKLKKAGMEPKVVTSTPGSLF